jgi:hypothetical protein
MQPRTAENFLLGRTTPSGIHFLRAYAMIPEFTAEVRRLTECPRPLLSGIGGFSLGLERAGMRTVAFCEIEPYCRAVLKKHWPNVPCYDDVRTLTADRLRADGIVPDVICGGFPCQDISVAGRCRD